MAATGTPQQAPWGEAQGALGSSPGLRSWLGSPAGELPAFSQQGAAR